MNLLRAQNLTVRFPGKRSGWLPNRTTGMVRAVNDVSLDLKAGETLGLVGESGCGKSTLARALLQLIRPTSGNVFFHDQELTRLWEKKWLSSSFKWSESLRQYRRKMQMIFQDPYSSLDPRMTAERLIGEPLATFGLMKGRELNTWVKALMEKVGLDPAYLGHFPHEFSGGQCQRIGIARALALQPELIIADEPVSALDVSVQAQVLNLLNDLKKDLGLTLLFISHDLSAVAQVSDRIAVMYMGKIVEEGSCEQVCDDPAHPYTQTLIEAIPIPDPVKERNRKPTLPQEDRSDISTPSRGCVYHARCPVREDRCLTEEPQPKPLKGGGEVSCWVSGNSRPLA